MELKIFLSTLLKRWWIILPVLVITICCTGLFTYLQTPVYSATATFVVSPSANSLDARGVLTGLDILGARTMVANTYAEIATSNLVRQGAIMGLELSPSQSAGLSVDSKNVAGTNVIAITVEGADPALVTTFANKLGEITVNYGERLYGVYDLKPLDQAMPPLAPIRPKPMLYLTIGAVLGLVLGLGLAIFHAYLQTPVETQIKADSLYDVSGAFNRNYFDQRLHEELSRVRHCQYALTIGIINVDPKNAIQSRVPSDYQNEALQMVTAFCKRQLREEDIFARLEGTIFGVLIPDISQEQAKDMLKHLHTSMAKKSFEIERCGIKLNLIGASGLVSYNYNGTGQKELLSRAYLALERAEKQTGDNVYYSSENE